MHDRDRRIVIIRERVRIVQAGQDLRQHAYLHVEREQLGRVARPADPLEGLALEVLHRDVVAAVILADVVGLHDVGVVEPRGEASLVEEHPAELVVLGEVAPQQLERHELLKPGQAALRDGQVDLGHPTKPDLGQEAVLAERFG